MSDYKEELSALVEKIRQDGAKEERRRITEKLKGIEFCAYNHDKNCINDCLVHIEKYLSVDIKDSGLQ